MKSGRPRADCHGDPAFNLPPMSTEFEPSNENDPTIRETAEEFGLAAFESQNLVAATRRFEKSTGTKVAYDAGGHPRLAGFTPPSSPNLIFVRAGRDGLPPTVGEPRHSAVPLAGRWALASKPMTQPEPERPLRLARLTRRRDGLGEVGGCILSLEDRLPADAHRRRRFSNRASFLQFSED
jgi:hypothetical protein